MSKIHLIYKAQNKIKECLRGNSVGNLYSQIHGDIK